MAYTAKGIDQRAEVAQHATVQDTLEFWPLVDGAPVVPSAGSLTVYGPGGAVVVARAAATVGGTSGRMSLTQAWTAGAYPLDEDYHALWEFTVGSATYMERQYFDVVLAKLSCPVETNDLLEVYPNIDKMLVAVGVSDASRPVKRAWAWVLSKIRGTGLRPSLVLDRSRLHEPTLERALYYACDSLMRQPDDLWERRALRHEKDADAALASIGELKYDEDEDGVADEGEQVNPTRPRFYV